MFKEGRTNIHDEDRSGRPSVMTDDLVEEVNTKIQENRRFTISALSVEFSEVSRSVIYDIVTRNLGYKKLCSRWVPKMLTDEHKQKRLASAQKFLQRYRNEGDEFLGHIVTGDETWISYTNVESKQQSMQWRHSWSPKAKKFKQAPSVKKIMATVFWDKKGVLFIDFLERGKTINANAYCDTLIKLRRAIQNKRRGLLSTGIVLLHDNARPHTADRTVQLLQKFHWEIFDHAPYSPNLAPSDYHLFMHLKKWLASQRFETDDELQTGVNEWFKTLAADFFDTGIKNLVPRYQKCVEVNGDYVEK
jgi:[histone H3]-lysine36 N-dimethyltransferase SETMAR